MASGHGENTTLSRDDVLSAVRALRLVFWGGLLCVFEYSPVQVGGALGWRFDVFNDVAGMILIAVAVLRLARLRVHPAWNDHYGSAMRWVRAVALVGVAEAAMRHLVFTHPTLLDISLAGFRIVQVGTMVLFCLSMRWLCAAAGLASLRRSWDITTGLFVCVWLIPLGIVFCTDFLSLMAGRAPLRELGAFKYVLQAMLAAPFVGLYVSTSRMAKEARAKDRDADARAAARDSEQ